jgi:hypothetical protein
MTTPSIPFNFAPTDPSLKDLLDLLKKDIALSTNCHHVAKIQSFDSAKQTITATINYKKTQFQLDATTGLYGPVLLDYPVLIDCPVIVMGGGNGHLTFPLAKGDDCLILFNDRAIDTWFQGSSNGAVPIARFHSLSDGFALVGVNSMGSLIANYDGTRALLSNGTAGVGVGASLIKIFNDTYTLGTLLQNLLTTLETLTTTPAVVGNPSTLDPAVITALQNIGTQLGALLE